MALLVGAHLPGCGPSVSAPDADGTTGTETLGGSTEGATTNTASGADLDTSSEPPATSTIGSTTTSVADGTSTGDDESTGDPPARAVPTRVLFFYTPHGYYEEHGWGGGPGQLGSMLAALEPYGDRMLVVDGIENIGIDPEGIDVEDAHSTSSPALLTGGLLGSGILGDDTTFNPHLAGGPSLDVVLGPLLSRNDALSSVHLGVRASTAETIPLGVSYLAADEPNPAILLPSVAFDAMFGDVPREDRLAALEASVAGISETDPSGLLEGHLALAAAAFERDITRVQLVSVDIGLAQIRWQSLGVSDIFHDVLVLGQPSDAEPVYAYWGERLAAFLQDLERTAGRDGTTLLDETLVVWVSDMGSIPAAHTRSSILCVVIDGSGTFAAGHAMLVEGEADQADLAATIADAMDVDIGDFGHPDLDASSLTMLLTR